MSRRASRLPEESVNILVTAPIGKKCLRQIADVSPKIKLQDVSDLVSAEQAGDLKATERLDALLSEVEVIYGAEPPKRLVARAPKLRWIQSKLAGIAPFLTDDVVKSKVIITSTRGIHDTQVSEFVLEIMLMCVKHAPLYFRLKQEKRWERFTPEVLRSKTVGIVGLGPIGRAVARLAKAFGMRVIAVEIKRLDRARYVDLILPPERLQQLLSESDFVVITLPLTPETNRLIGETELRTMKSTAYLINVSRGPIVDEEALIHALSENWIAGAGLDVFTIEPLPADSKIWELPNVIFSPHVAGTLATYNEMAAELFCENLRHYLKGKRLRNVINKKRGY